MPKMLYTHRSLRPLPSIVVLTLLFASLACSFTVSLDSPTQVHPTVALNTLRATFLGQDGGAYAGRLCSNGTTNDNVHIYLTGLRTDVEPVSYRVDDYAKGGVWATPCDPVSNWLLYIKHISDGEADLYFKPFRDAPDRTEYLVTVRYSDGQTQAVSVLGSRVKP